MGLLVGDILATAAANRPGAVAATLGADHVTFAAADETADRTAHALRHLGVGHGDVVAWWTDTSLRCLDGFVAAARLGAAFAPVSPLLGADEACPALDLLRPRVLVCDADRADAVAPVADDLGVPLAVMGDTADGTSSTDLDRLAGQAPDGPVREPALGEGDAHVVYLTSGTTGAPKGVVVSHRASWLRSFPGAGTFSLGVHGHGGVLTCFPLFHYGGWHYVLEAWHAGHAVHLVRRASADELLGAVERRRPSGLYAIPAVWDRVLAAADGSVDLSCVRHADTGTSATPPDLLARIGARIPGATTSVFYGSTEAGHHTTLPHWDVDRKPGSVGRPAPGTRVRVADDGEICVAGPTLMSGYLHRPDATAAAVVDGWYRTGDLGRLDDEGYLWVTGRVREVIRTGGETVAPAEVEAALGAVPGVRDAAVVGVPDPRWGEVVGAALVVDDDAPPPSVEQVRRHLAGRLAPFKHPRRVVVVPALPRTAATGQVQRARLRASFTGADAPAADGGHEAGHPEEVAT